MSVRCKLCGENNTDPDSLCWRCGHDLSKQAVSETQTKGGMKLTAEELGTELQRAIPELIEREIRREMIDIQKRIEERVRSAIGIVRTDMHADRRMGFLEITISFTIGGEPEKDS